jgi:hypothetical protein
MIFFRLLKNVQMQGSRNPEERTWRYAAQACPVLDTGKDERNAADGLFSAVC